MPDPTRRVVTGSPAAVRTEYKRPAVKCTGKKRDGSPCTAYAMLGQDVCHAHGGKRKANKKAAAAKMVEERARRALVSLDIYPVDNYLLELRRVAGEALAWNAVCRQMIESLSPERYRFESQAGLEQIRGEVQLYERALDRSANILATVARVDVDERLAAIEEAKAQMLAAALSAALLKAGITGEASTAVRMEFARRLKVIPGRAEPGAA